MKKLLIKLLDKVCEKVHGRSYSKLIKGLAQCQEEVNFQKAQNRVLSQSIVKVSRFYQQLKHILANRSIEINGRGHYVSLNDISNMVKEYEGTQFDSGKKATQAYHSLKKTIN